MPESYKWKVTLKDSSIKEEDKDKFDLAWEKEGSVKQIELVGEKKFSCNLETGEFNVDGEVSTPKDIIGLKKLYFRKRRQVRTDGHNLLDTRTKYLFGYEVNSQLHIASVQPELGMMAEKIAKPEVQAVVNGKFASGIVGDEVDFRSELISLDGIGQKTADFIIANIASSKEELSKVPRETLIDKLRDDVVEVLEEYLE